MTEEIVVSDIGGTHARFAIATIDDGHIVSLNDQLTLKSGDHPSLQTAWQAYGREIGRPLPRSGAIAVAGHVGGEVLHLTNNSWMIRPAMIPEKLGLDRFTLINDFGAVGHAVALLGSDQFQHICGPQTDIPDQGLVTILGPGTGLGVAHVLKMASGYHVTETEGGHVDFAPHDIIEDRLLQKLREHHRRVSVERIVAGPGLQVIYKVFAEMEGQQAKQLDDKALWQLALSGEDSIAAAAFDRFCLCLGSFAGDVTLAHGARSVVIAGALAAGLRIVCHHRAFANGSGQRGGLKA